MRRFNFKVVWIFILLLSFSQLVLGGSTLGTQKVGMIQAVDLPDRTIQIGTQTYLLSDNLQVYAPENALKSRLALQVGEQIEFWYTTPRGATPDNPSALPEINKINIKSGFVEKLKS